MNKDLTYLTVQDVVWIHSQIAGDQRSFNYAALEESVSAQYHYGSNLAVTSCAEIFAKTFFNKKPFSLYNEAAVLVSFAAFLRLNGWELQVDSHDVFSAFLDFIQEKKSSKELFDLYAIYTQQPSNGSKQILKPYVKSVLDKLPERWSG